MVIGCTFWMHGQDTGGYPTWFQPLMELQAACEPALDKLLFDLYSDLLKNVDEKQLLEYIKKAAVVSIHKEVHRQTFFRMVQGEMSQ